MVLLNNSMDLAKKALELAWGTIKLIKITRTEVVKGHYTDLMTNPQIVLNLAKTAVLVRVQLTHLLSTRV
jgi:hypothetical protein